MKFQAVDYRIVACAVRPTRRSASLKHSCAVFTHRLRLHFSDNLLLHSGGGSCGLWLYLRQWSAGIQTNGSGVVLCLLLSSLFSALFTFNALS